MRESRKLLRWCSALVITAIVLLAPAFSAYGQAITGRLVGTVRDANQAAIPKAKVTVASQDTGISWEFQTDEQGNYVAPSLPSGAYKLTVGASGFRQAVANNVVVNVAQTTRVDVAMEIGNVQETVEVATTAPLVQSTTSDLGEIVEKRQIQTLPLNGRIFSQLIQLVPGAVPAGFGAAPEAASTAGARTFTSASVNGLPWSGTVYYLDGIENKETLNAFVSMSPPIEAINHGYHIFRNRPINVPTSPGPGAIDPRRPYAAIFPRTQNITERGSDGSSSYHGLQVKYSKRLSAGLQALVSYTFSKTIDNTNIVWPYDDTFNRGVGTGKAPDVPHVFAASYLYELPFGKGRKLLGDIPRALDFVIGGWQVNGITSVRTGTPLVVTVATSQLNTTTGNYANLACSDVGRPKTVEQWFDRSCFTAPAQFVFGNSGKSQVRGPGAVNFDLSLFKKFAIDEKRAIEFRSEFFNAFNNPHFANPNTSLGNANFGRISGTVLTPREIQLGLKLTF